MFIKLHLRQLPILPSTQMACLVSVPGEIGLKGDASITVRMDARKNREDFAHSRELAKIQPSECAGASGWRDSALVNCISENYTVYVALARAADAALSCAIRL